MHLSLRKNHRVVSYGIMEKILKPDVPDEN